MKTETFHFDNLGDAYLFAGTRHFEDLKVWKIEVARNDDGTAEVRVVSQRVAFDE